MSSNVTAYIELDGTDLKTRIDQVVKLSEALASGQDVETLACVKIAANQYECAYCKGAYTSLTNYTGSVSTLTWTTTSPTL